MFFELSKIFWMLAQPANLLFIFLAIATWLLWVRPELGRWIITVLVVMGWLAATIPAGEYLIRQIENEYPQPQLPEHVDGIIVLGGFIWAEGSFIRKQVQTDSKADRFFAFIKLSRQYPNAKLIFTGGSGNIWNQQAREADYVKELWHDMGYDPARLLIERESHNTYENVVYSKAIVQPQPGEKWILITSAMHMPRSVAIFKEQNWDVIPYPVDYISGNGSLWQYEFSVNDNLFRLSVSLREIIGKLVYQLSGRAA